jgi:sodium/proline symporter
MGLPGVALLTGVLGNTTGFAEAVWTALGLGVGTYLNFLLVARRIRLYSERTGSTTIPAFLSDRFGDKKGILTAIAAVVIVIFFVPYTASGFSAIGKLLNSVFGIDYHVAMIVGSIVLVVYTMLGGFLAASVTDLMQSIVMTVALFVVIGFGLEYAGGVDGVRDALLSHETINSVGQFFNLFGTDGKSYGFLPVVSTLAWGLGYFGMPHILLRFMAIENEEKLKISRRIATVWVFVSMAIAILIGVIGYSFVANEGLIGAEGFDAERIVIYIADAISRLDSFGAVVAGLILAGILASIMSTADSQLLAASSSVSENIVKRFFWKNMSEKTQMWLARATVAVIAVIAMFLAWDQNSSVFRIVSFAWAGFGAAFGPAIFCALFWRRTNKWGAFAGILTGAATVFIWKYLIRPLGGAWDIYELLPAFILGAIAIVAVSLLTGKPENEVTETYDAFRADYRARTAKKSVAAKTEDAE